MVETNSGVRLDRVIRAGACGTWWSAATAGGHPLGVLQLDVALIADSAARERLAASVAAVRELNAAGVLRTTELVVEAGRAWLVVAHTPAPTVADLFAAAVRLDLAAAAAIAVDAGEALRQLHAAGLTHGALTPDTVALTPAGQAVLAEVGVLAALRDRPTDLGQDGLAWAALVRQLATAVPGGSAELLAVAAVAATGDLTTAVRRASFVPDVFGDRESLTVLLPAALASSPRSPASEPAPDRLGTLDTVGALDTVDSADGGVRLRFGRGLPDAVIMAHSRGVDAAAPSRADGPPRTRRLGRLLVALVASLLLGAAGAWWLLLGPR